jgi:hypothetical protein
MADRFVPNTTDARALVLKPTSEGKVSAFWAPIVAWDMGAATNEKPPRPIISVAVPEGSAWVVQLRPNTVRSRFAHPVRGDVWTLDGMMEAVAAHLGVEVGHVQLAWVNLTR